MGMSRRAFCLTCAFAGLLHKGDTMVEGVVQETGSVILDGAGSGQVVLQPGRAGLWWTITHMATSGDSALQIVKLDVYRSVVTPQQNLDHSDSANGDISECNYPIGPGESLVFVWTGGTVGARMNIRIEGTFRRS